MANLVIIESPGKISTIKNILGSNYKVLASVGHIRDLPKSTLSVDIENHFEPHYINIRGKGDIIRQLKKEAKNANKVFLATDPDREGEAISWHIATVLGIPMDKACRVTFNEITQGAIKEGIKHPRTIDKNLVNAQQTRRILDRIIGYKLSGFFWENVKSGLSAGRVQSAVARIIVEREAEIKSFEPKEYWTMSAALATADGSKIDAALYGNAAGKLKVETEAQMQEIEDAVRGHDFRVASVKHAQKSKQPAPPFTTSTMQQEASKKLGFQSQRIMKVAQELYEGIDLGSEHGGVQGLITYMRTDSLRVSAVAQEAAVAYITQNYGAEYAPKTPRVYKSKAGAQDAHEAIRPTRPDLFPKAIRKYLSLDQYRLYKLIWERFMASQMASALLDTVSIDFESQGYIFRTSGYTIAFRGYLAVYENAEAERDSENRDENDDTTFSRLPVVAEGDTLQTLSLEKAQHFTEPPPRYNDASLVKFLEENGIGRPSTYAPIINKIIEHRYVKREGKSFVPTQLGEITTKILLEQFPEIVDYEFTATMETELDKIEEGTMSPEGVLQGFYDVFSKSLEAASQNVRRGDVEIAPEESGVICELCGSRMVYKNGRFGRFLACPNYPACRNTKAVDKDGNPVEKKEEPTEIADFKCELCGGDMVLRHGRYGDFYACVNYPTCKFTKQKVVDIGVACPLCGARIVERHGNGRSSFYSCERYPDCKFSTWDLPTNETCPSCGKMLFRKKARHLIVCHDKACGYKREVEPDEVGGEED